MSRLGRRFPIPVLYEKVFFALFPIVINMEVAILTITAVDPVITGLTNPTIRFRRGNLGGRGDILRMRIR